MTYQQKTTYEWKLEEWNTKSNDLAVDFEPTLWDAFRRARCNIRKITQYGAILSGLSVYSTMDEEGDADYWMVCLNKRVWKRFKQYDKSDTGMEGYWIEDDDLFYLYLCRRTGDFVFYPEDLENHKIPKKYLAELDQYNNRVYG